MKNASGYLFKSMAVVIIIAVSTLLLSATTKTERKNAVSSKGDKLKTIAKKKLPMKACSADFVIENAASSTEITSFSVTSNSTGINPSTYNGGYSIYPSGSVTLYNTVHLWNVGSSDTEVTLTWDIPRGGIILLYDLFTSAFLKKYVIPANSVTYTFTYAPLTCNGFTTRFSPLE